jgi:hypothetical protein
VGQRFDASRRWRGLEHIGRSLIHQPVGDDSSLS